MSTVLKTTKKSRVWRTFCRGMQERAWPLLFDNDFGIVKTMKPQKFWKNNVFVAVILCLILFMTLLVLGEKAHDRKAIAEEIKNIEAITRLDFPDNAAKKVATWKLEETPWHVKEWQREVMLVFEDSEAIHALLQQKPLGQSWHYVHHGINWSHLLHKVNLDLEDIFVEFKTDDGSYHGILLISPEENKVLFTFGE